MTKESKFRELTPEEIEALPFELRLCFESYPWNIHADIKSADEWFNMFQVFGVSVETRDIIKYAASRFSKITQK